MNEKENFSVTKQIEKNNDKPTRNPISVFVYALKAPETRRQYHRRLKVFLNFLDLGTDVLEDQARILYQKPRRIQHGLKVPSWSLMDFKRIESNEERYLFQLSQITRQP